MKTPTEKKIPLGTIAMIQNSDIFPNGDLVVVYRRDRILQAGHNRMYRFCYHVLYGQEVKWRDRKWEIELRPAILYSENLYPLSHDPEWGWVMAYANLFEELMEDIRTANINLFRKFGI